MHDDLSGDRVRVGDAVVFLGEMSQHHVRAELAQHAGQAPHDLLGDQQHRVVGAEEDDVLDPQRGAGGAGLLLLDVGALPHRGAQLVRFRDDVAVEHLLADDLVVDPRAVGQHHAADPVAARDVVGHGAAGLIEDVGRVGPDGKNPQWLVHDAAIMPRSGPCRSCVPRCCVAGGHQTVGRFTRRSRFPVRCPHVYRAARPPGDHARSFEIASLRLCRASGLVRPWPFAPGISRQEATNQR